MGVFESGGRLIDRGAGAAWRGAKKLDPISRSALIGAAVGAAHARATRRRDDLTGEREPAAKPTLDGALRGAGIGAVGALAASGVKQWWTKSAARRKSGLTALLARLTRGHGGQKRSQMPQFDGPTMEKFCAWLKARGIGSLERNLHLGEVRPTQRHFDAAKVRGMIEQFRSGKFPKLYAPIMVSADNFILDGHHRWAAMVALRDEKRGPDDVVMLRLGLTMKQLLPLAREFKGVRFKPLRKAAAAFRDELAKTARVFGAEYDPDQVYNPLLPRRERLRHVQETVQKKAREPETKWRNALLGGGALGAAGGALTGARAGWRGAAVGAGLGAALGAGIGAMAKTRDDQALLRARYLHRRPHLLKRELNELSQEHARAERRQAAVDAVERDARHAELMRKLDRLERRRDGRD